jgi:hypothetical protein
MNRILTAHKAVNDFCTIATYNMYIINKVIKRSQYQHINKDVCSIGKGILTYPEEISEYFLSELYHWSKKLKNGPFLIFIGVKLTHKIKH